MAYRTNSDWSLNKKKPDLVYAFNDGSSTTYRKVDNQIFEVVTSEGNGISMRLVPDFEMTIAQFDFFKEWSDDNYHTTDIEDSAESKGKVDYDDVSNTLQASVHLFKVKEFDPQPYRNKECALLVLGQLKLTTVQQRRLDLFLAGNSTTDIAKLEGVNQSAVWKSLDSVRKKSQKIILKNFSKKGW